MLKRKRKKYLDQVTMLNEIQAALCVVTAPTHVDYTDQRGEFLFASVLFSNGRDSAGWKMKSHHASLHQSAFSNVFG